MAHIWLTEAVLRLIYGSLMAQIRPIYGFMGLYAERFAAPLYGVDSGEAATVYYMLASSPLVLAAFNPEHCSVY